MWLTNKYELKIFISNKRISEITIREKLFNAKELQEKVKKELDDICDKYPSEQELIEELINNQFKLSIAKKKEEDFELINELEDKYFKIKDELKKRIDDRETRNNIMKIINNCDNIIWELWWSTVTIVHSLEYSKGKELYLSGTVNEVQSERWEARIEESEQNWINSKQ